MDLSDQEQRDGKRPAVYVTECCNMRYLSANIMRIRHMNGCPGAAKDRAIERLLANPPAPAKVPPAELLEGLPPEAEAFFSPQFERHWDSRDCRRAWQLTENWTQADRRLFRELAGRLPSPLRPRGWLQR